MMQPLAAAGSTSSQVNTSLSTMISFSIINSSGKEISIHAQDEEPIELIIPRDPDLKVPPMKLYNVTSLYDPTEQFHFLSVNITQSNQNLTASFHLEIRPLNLSLNYLLIFKFDGKPHLNSSMKDINYWTLLCSSSERFPCFSYRSQYLNFRHIQRWYSSILYK